MDRVSITITNPDVIEIFKRLKKGTSKRFAVERAMEMLYNDPQANSLLFDSDPVKDKEAQPSAPAEPETAKQPNDDHDHDEEARQQPSDTQSSGESVKMIQF